MRAENHLYDKRCDGDADIVAQQVATDQTKVANEGRAKRKE